MQLYSTLLGLKSNIFCSQADIFFPLSIKDLFIHLLIEAGIHTDMLVESVLNLIFHLHAAELHHFGGHVLKYSSHNMETSRRMEFLAVGLKSNNCSDVSHAIVRETMTAITIQSLTSGVNISNMTRLFPLRTLLRISLRQGFIAQHEYFKDGNMFLPAPVFFLF